MNTNPYNATYDHVNSDVGVLVHKVQMSNARAALDGAFEVGHYLTSKQYDLVASLFAPRPIKNREKNLSRHPHPIPALLNRYAYEECIRVAGKSPAMDIGGSPYRTPITHHICALVNDARTDARYVNCAFECGRIKDSLLEKHEFDRYLNGHNKVPMCRNGTVNCHYKCAYAYMINVYDVDIFTLPEIFENHGLLIMDIWMFLPYNLSVEDRTLDQKFYKNEIFTDTDGLRKCRFSLGDNSNNYIHEYTNWQRYALTTLITCENFSLVFEHCEQLGTFTRIRVTKSSYNNGYIIRNISMPEYDGLIQIPNMRHYLEHRSATTDPFAKSFFIDAEMANRLISYGEKQTDTQIGYPNFAAHMDGCRANIYYDVGGSKQLVYKGLEMTPDDYLDLKISCYMLTLLQRYHRTQTIADLIGIMKSNKPGFLSQFFHTCRKIKAAIVGFFTDCAKDPTYIYNVMARKPLAVSADLRLRVDFKSSVHHVCYKTYKWRSYEQPSYERDASDLATHPKLHVEKSATTRVVTAADGKVLQTKTRAHCQIVHNPPGDGKCAEHALRWFLEKNNMSYMRPNGIMNNGKPEALPSDWWDAAALMGATTANGCNVIIHYVHNGIDIVERDFPHDGAPTARFKLENRHWTVVDCDCRDKDYYTGFYRDIPVDDAHLYINCANDQCSDGAGQAADFARMFPGYRNNVVVPAPPVQFIKYKGRHLCIAVAHNLNQKDDKLLSDKIYQQIFKGIADYCNKHNLVAYMPLLGTSIFGNPVCCYKRNLAMHKFSKTMCFLNAQQIEQYEAAKCTHGGYHIHAVGELTPVRSKYDNTNYLALRQAHDYNHMRIKYEDHITFTYHTYAKEIPIIELSGAPGHFAKFAKKDHYPYKAFHYVPGDFRWIYGQPDARYNDVDELLTLVKKEVAGKPDQKLQFLLDLPLDDDMIPQFYPVFDVILQNHLLVFKVELYNPKVTLREFYDRYKNTCSAVYSNNGSYNTSSELYVCISRAPTGTPKVTVDLDLVLADKDARALQKQNAELSGNCKCRYDYDTNATYSWQHDDLAYLEFLHDLSNDQMVMAKQYEKHGFDPYQLRSIPKCTDAIPVLNGIGGSRKSTTALKSGCAKCTMIIAPYRAVVDAQNASVNGISDTFVAAIIDLAKRGKSLRYLFIDEVFAINPYFVNVYKYYVGPECQIYGLGDSKQVTCRDYEKTMPKVDLRYNPGDHYRLETYRVPQTLLALIQYQVPEGELISHSKEPGVITYKDADEIYNVKDGTILAHTQRLKDDIKAHLSKLYRVKAMTVNESAGLTLDKVHLYVSDIDQIVSDKQKYVFTAVTRCSRELVIYGDKTEVEQYFRIEGTAIERALLANNVFPHGGIVVDTKLEDVPMPEVCEKVRSINGPAVTVDAVREVLDQVYVPANVTDTNVVDYKLNMLYENADGNKFKVSPNVTNATGDITVKAKKFGYFFYNRSYHGSDMLKGTQTLLQRYAKQTKHLDPKMLHKYCAGFEKFLRPDWREHIKDHRVTFEEVWLNTCEYLIALQKKLNSQLTGIHQEIDKIFVQYMELADVDRDKTLDEDIKKLSEAFYYNMDYTANMKNLDDFHKIMEKQQVDWDILRHRMFTHLRNRLQTLYQKLEQKVVTSKIVELETEWTESKHRLVSFHMKAQPKEIRGADFDTKDKAGQGISAWSKMMNVIFSGMTRTLAQKFASLVDHKVLIAYGKSDKDIGKIFMQHASVIFNPNYKSVAADITEFDSSQEQKGIMASIVLMRSYGFDNKVVDMYYELRRRWTLQMLGNVHGESYNAILDGFFKQHSGQPLTLDGNTIFNMSMIGACYDLGKVYFAAFKGDDSFVTCQHVKEHALNTSSILKECGFKVKMEQQRTLEFIANIITPYGFYPDVVRRVSRVVSKLYNTKQDWDEVKLSIADSISVVMNDNHLIDGAKFAAMYYNERGINITHDQVLLLTNFLHRCVFDDDFAPKVEDDWVFRTLDITQYLTHPMYQRSGGNIAVTTELL